MRERGGDYREFGAQCYGTLGEACAANLAEAAVGLASASECSSPSPSPTDPQTPIFFIKKTEFLEGSERMNATHKNNRFKIYCFWQNQLKIRSY